jgi:hypothetical protein
VTSLLYVVPEADAKQLVAAPIKAKWKLVNIRSTSRALDCHLQSLERKSTGSQYAVRDLSIVVYNLGFNRKVIQ